MANSATQTTYQENPPAKSVYETGQLYHGFRLLEKRFIEDIQAEVYHFEYEKTKTTLIAIKNNDENKNFCVGFKTLPEDSSGVCHILEHSVLSGSRKYPIKDVFSEMTKGSLTTFINAMTYSDKTLYPFATRNEKEYFNLMDVYLDLTLNPLLEENTFLQEGWHYEIAAPDQPLEYNGIVYNEMKGVYSSPFRYLFEKVTSHLLPNSTYSVSSGGMPENIPELTFEYFKEFHHKNYHPSNAKLAVYGNADLDRELQFLDQNYLSKFDYLPVVNEIKSGNGLKAPIVTEETYASSSETSAEDDTYMSLAVTTGTLDGREKFLALNILADLLMNTEASPLKNAMLEAELGSEVGCVFEDIYQSFFLFYIMGADAKGTKKLQEVYNQTLSQIVKEGFDKDLLEGQLNTFEFQTREENANTKRGLNYTLEIMAQLMYQNDFFDSLQDIKILGRIRKLALKERYFEKLIEKYLLGNPETVVFVLKPDPKKTETEALQMKEKLSAIKKSLSDQAISQLVEKTKELKKIQLLPNSPEKLALLPKLNLSDINPKITRQLPQVTEIENVKVLSSELYTGQIGYLNIGFDISHLPQELLPYLDLFSEIFTEIGTSNRDYKTLSKDLGLYTGGLSSSFNIHHQKNLQDSFKPILWFNIKATLENIEKTFELLQDIFFHCDFSNQKRIAEIVKRVFAHEQYSLSSDGYSLALQRMDAYFSNSGKMAEYISGYTAYKILKNLEKNYKKEEKKFLEVLLQLYTTLFNKNNLLINVTAQGDVLQSIRKHLPQFISKFSAAQVLGPQSYQWPSFNQNESFLLPIEVVYTGMGFNMHDIGMPYNGALEVLKNYLDNDYLYNQIRVVGGAYGNFSRLNRFSGSFNFISYRDPNIDKTYQAYNSIPRAITEMNLPQTVIDQLKINSFAKFDPLLSSAQKGVSARNDYLSGVTVDDLNKTIEEILAVDNQKLKSFAAAFQEALKTSRRCTIGSSVKIKENSSYFDAAIEI